MASTRDKRTVVNYSMIVSKAQGKATAEASNACSVRMDGKTALMFSFMKCHARGVGMTSAQVSITLGTSARALRRYVMMNCTGRTQGVIYNTAPLSVIQNVPYCKGVSSRRCGRVRRGKFGRILSAPLSAFSVSISTTSCDGVHHFLGGKRLPPAGTVHARRLVGCFSCGCTHPAKGSPIEVAARMNAYP